MAGPGRRVIVQVDIVGPLRRPRGTRRFDVEVSEGARVGDVLEAAGYTPEEARRIQVLVAGEAVTREAPASAGGILTLYLPVGGG